MDDPGNPDFVQRSHGMRRLLAALHRLPPTERFVVVRGEPGTGRRRVARWLHRAWWGRGAPVVIDCALPAEMLRPSLAYSSDLKKRNPTTLVLHSVHELDESLDSRVPYLATSLGVGNASRWTLVVTEVPDTASSDHLLRRFANAPTLLVPALRDRRMDIAGLVRASLTEICEDEGDFPNRVSADALDALASYHWPGNLPELHAVLERARLCAGEDRIDLADLPREIRRPREQEGAATETLAEVERLHILATVQRFGGHRGDTAEALGIHVNTLCKRLATYGVGRRRRSRASRLQIPVNLNARIVAA